MTHTYGPYSPAREAGNLVFVSGQVGINPENRVAPKDIGLQTERALLNLEAILRQENVSLNDIIKTTIYLTDMADFEAMNEVYEQRFDVPRPARSTVAVKELPRVAGDIKILVEIEAIAQKGRS